MRCNLKHLAQGEHQGIPRHTQPSTPGTHHPPHHHLGCRFCCAAHQQDPWLSALSSVYGSVIQQPGHNYTCACERAVKYPQYSDKQQSFSNILDENSWQLRLGKSQRTVVASPAYAGPSERELQTTCRCQKDFCLQSWQHFPYTPCCLFLEVKKCKNFFTELKTKELHNT